MSPVDEFLLFGLFPSAVTSPYMLRNLSLNPISSNFEAKARESTWASAIDILAKANRKSKLSCKGINV